MSQNDPSKVLLLAVPVLLMATGGGWVGDSIVDLILGDGRRTGVLLVVLLAGLLVFLGGAYWIYYMRKDFLPARILARTNLIPPRKAMISMVSTPNFEFIDMPARSDGKVRIRMNRTKEELTLSGDLEIDTAETDIQWNWQQLLRAIKPHVNTLKRIHLIGSSGTRGSHASLAVCAELLRQYLNDEITVTMEAEGVELDDIDALIRRIREAIGKLKKDHYFDSDIMIDSTGGPKTASIASALVTLSSPRLHFQYVSMHDQRPLAFNVVAEQQGDVG